MHWSPNDSRLSYPWNLKRFCPRLAELFDKSNSSTGSGVLQGRYVYFLLETALEMSALGTFGKVHYMSRAGYQCRFGVAADDIDLFKLNILR